MITLSTIIDQSAIIILHYKDPVLTAQCIAAFYTPGLTPDIILIDNDPENRYRPFQDKRIIYLPQPENKGFAAGVNIGLQSAIALEKKVVILLNNDVSAPLYAILRLLCHASIQPDIFGGIEYHWPENRDHGIVRHHNPIFAGGKIVWQQTPVRIDTNPPRSNRLYSTQFIRASFMAFPLHLVRHIGFMEEIFGSYMEDVDFCLRAVTANYGLWIDPQAVVRHRLARASTPYSRNYLMAKNYVRLLYRHTHGPVFLTALIYCFLSAAASLVRPDRKGKFTGFIHGLSETRGVLGTLIRKRVHEKITHEKKFP